MEFIASVYNVHLRREQVQAVEAVFKSGHLTEEELRNLQAVTAKGLMATAMAEGDVNSVRELLRRKDLDLPIKEAFRKMQIIQRNVRGSEAEKDSLLPKFFALRLWSGCSSLFFTLNPTTFTTR